MSEKDKDNREAILKVFGEDKLETYDLMKDGVSKILDGLKKGSYIKKDDPNFVETPHRVAKMYLEMFVTEKEREDATKKYFTKTFPSKYGGMVFQTGIEAFSMCPHHFMPVEIIGHVAYIPNGKDLEKDDDDNDKFGTVGISKLARIVQISAKQPVLQEELTQIVADAIIELIKPKGVGVVIEARHMCMCARGAAQHRSWTITAVNSGIFQTETTKREFNSFIALSKNRSR